MSVTDGRRPAGWGVVTAAAYDRDRDLEYGVPDGGDCRPPTLDGSGDNIETGEGVDGEVWGEASVTYPDWKGTAQLDERMTVPWEGLARTVGLDSDKWQVVGFSIGGGEHGYDLRVVATPHDVWEKVKPDDDVEIEATEFLVHDVDPLAILRQMTHVFELRMRIRALDGRRVRVRALSDLPSELFVEEHFGPQTD